LNASHGTPEQHVRAISRVREAGKQTGRQKGILLDLQGPKIRLGKFEGGKCELESGSRFVLTTGEVMGNSQRASTTYKELPSDVRPGNRILAGGWRGRIARCERLRHRRNLRGCLRGLDWRS